MIPKDRHADDHVQCVQARQHEVKDEVQFDGSQRRIEVMVGPVLAHLGIGLNVVAPGTRPLVVIMCVSHS